MNCNNQIDGAAQTDTVSNTSTYSKKALFDIIADVVTEPKKEGEDLIVKLSLINFGSSGSVDANLEYTIKS